MIYAQETNPAKIAKSAQAEEKTENAKPEPLKVTEPTKLDQAGEKIGENIEAFADKASRRVGNWINAKTIADISWLKLSFCLVLLFGVFLLERIIRWAIQKRIERIPQIEGKISWIRLFLIALNKPLSLFILIYGAYGALTPIFGHFQSDEGGNLVHFAAQKAFQIGGSIAIIWFVFSLVNLIDARLKRWAEGTESTIDNILVPLVGKTLRVFIVIVGGMLAIQNLTGIEIGPLVASLGIGGVAVALAAKDSIANFFGTLTIIFDKPFQVGERIVIDDYDGTVEHVGFRSTRIRTLAGHLVTIPNEKLINSGLENIGKRPHIRWLTNIGITYDTPPDKVERAVAIINDILENHEGMDPEFPPRVAFNNFNDWSLNILVVAWYHPPEYWEYTAWLERTCLEIMRRFKVEGIEFAFPTRTLYMANDDKRQLKLELMQTNADRSLGE